jgi:glycosyltransferase involved in cell wall biosynthesis
MRHSMTRIDPRMQGRINRLIAQQRFDLVHVESIGFGNYSFGSHLPSVLTEHEVGRRQKGALHDKWTRQPSIWKQFDRIQVFTPRDADTLRARAPELADRVRVNPFGIDIPPEADPQREHPNTIAFVGGFRHWPNVDAAQRLATEIMPLLRTMSPGVRASIVGSHPPEKVRALACDDIVVAVDVPEVAPFLEQAAVVVAPLHTGGGMRVKVLQAMAMGKAVVTTPIGAEGITEAPDRPLIVADDAQHFARETAALLADAEKRRRLGRRARAFVQAHHTWAAYVERLEAIYAEVAPNQTVR